MSELDFNEFKTKYIITSIDTLLINKIKEILSKDLRPTTKQKHIEKLS